MNYLLAWLFFSIAGVIAWSLINMKAPEGYYWWAHVTAAFVGGFAFMSLFVVLAVIALQGWP